MGILDTFTARIHVNVFDIPSVIFLKSTKFGLLDRGMMHLVLFLDIHIYIYIFKLKIG